MSGPEQQNRSTEEAMRIAADKGMTVKTVKDRLENEGIVAGKPLPADFENPKIGTPTHRCLDPAGNYQPEWSSLKLFKTETSPARQHFNCAGKVWKPKYGIWVDVPPEVMQVLSYTVVDEISLEVDDGAPLVSTGVEQVVNEVPRFSYAHYKSA